MGEDDSNTDVTDGNESNNVTIVQQPNNKTRIVLSDQTTKPKRAGRPPNQRHTYENASTESFPLKQQSRHSDGESGLRATIKLDSESGNKQSVPSLKSPDTNTHARHGAPPPKPPIKPSRHSSHEKGIATSKNVSEIRHGSDKTYDKPPIQTKPIISQKNGSIKKSTSFDVRPPDLSLDTKPKTANKPPISAKPPTPVKPSGAFQYDLAGELSSSQQTSKPSPVTRRSQSVKNFTSGFSVLNNQVAIDNPSSQQGTAATDKGRPKPASYENAELKLSPKKATDNESATRPAIPSTPATYHLAVEPVAAPGNKFVIMGNKMIMM